jgi:hypothetical protein
MASQDKHCSSRLASIKSPQSPVGHSKCGVGSFHSRMLFLDTIPTLTPFRLLRQPAARQVGALMRSAPGPVSVLGQYRGLKPQRARGFLSLPCASCTGKYNDFVKSVD